MKAKPQSPFLRLQIAEDAKDALERQAARHKMSQTELASRLVSWIVRQSQTVQAAILNNIDRGLEEELAMSLRARAPGENAQTGKPPATDRKATRPKAGK